MTQLTNKLADTTPVCGNDIADDATMKALRAIVDERYSMSFERSRLTSAADMHREAKRVLGIESDYA
jgi:hypothetical protein